MDFVLLHLKGLHCSGRAVKFQPLDPDERDAILLLAAKEVGADGTMIDLKRMEWKYGVHKMIKQVSVEPVDGDPNDPSVKWKKHTPETMDQEYSKLFTAKDHALLTAAFRVYHEVSDQEVNAIVGKALTVSEG